MHRLDKDTSGLLLVAKHEQAASILNTLFAEHKASNKYTGMHEVLPLAFFVCL